MKNSVLLLLQKVVSPFVKFSDIDYSHDKVIILGFIKFSKLKSDIRKRRDLAIKTFNKYKDNNLDITTYPQATGLTRDLQLAEKVLLNELDYVCKKNGFDYWLDFGTLLGAVRHKGFIPWDDDIDVSMPRQYYKQIIEVFNRDTRNKNIKALYTRCHDKIANYIIRLNYKNYPVALDIFPYDFYGEVIPEEQRNEITAKIQAIRKPLHQKVITEGMSMENLAKSVDELNKQIFIHGSCEKNSNSSLVWGLDFGHTWPQWCWNYETIYPLNNIEFEGKMFPCPNKYDEYLKQVYGNYMSYPKEMSMGHTIYKLHNEDIIEIKKILEE